MLKKKRIIALILSVVLVICTLTSCGGKKNEIAEDNTSRQITKLEGGTSEAAEQEEETKPASKTQAKSEYSNTNTSNRISNEENPYVRSDDEVNSKAANNKKVNGCYVTVDGFCERKVINITSKDTAYSVLKKTGAKVSSKNTQYGIYVDGINDRFEFDEGPTSGWMYSVNGNKPNKSANKTKISKGDVIEWEYVTEFQ